MYIMINIIIIILFILIILIINLKLKHQLELDPLKYYILFIIINRSIFKTKKNNIYILNIIKLLI